MLDFTSSSIWPTLGLLLALGFRHGLDPDHIAAVDGLTRMRFKAQNYWSARLTGFQFASGHSLTVLLATLIFYWQGIEMPLWLDQLGLWISSAFLLWLAFTNFRYCLKGATHHHPNGWIQTLILKSLGPFAHPMGVGFAFALSLDTLGQAGLMAAKGHEMGGFAMIIWFALSFGLGMMLADSLNGLIVHWIVRQSEQLAKHTARLMSGVIALLSLMVVMFGLFKNLDTQLDEWWSETGAFIGIGITLALLILLVADKFRQRSKNTMLTKSCISSTHIH
jgi:nickel/cobalt transporter (NiCoT) family protein